MNNLPENKDHEKIITGLKHRIAELEKTVRELDGEKKEEEEKKEFYRSVADFSNDWELWFSPEGKLKYCSPSSIDITGYSPKQIIDEPSFSDSLVYQDDRKQFDLYLKDVLSLSIIRQSFQFRIVTRSRQVRWCEMSCRAVHDKYGRYLGIRASVRDITKLKDALGHIKQLSEERKFDRNVKQRLSGKLEEQEREVSSYLLLLSQKNELIRYLEKNISKLDRLNTKYRQKVIDEMLGKITMNNAADIGWDLFRYQFENLYPEFFKNLEVKHPGLSEYDLKLCTFLKLNLSSKEIAGLLNIAPKSVEVARVRLRKKLKLDRGNSLKVYFSQF